MYEVWTSIALLILPMLGAVLGWRLGYSVGYGDAEQSNETLGERNFHPWPWSK